MDTIFNTALDNVVKTRTSVRTYDKQQLTSAVKDQLTQYMHSLSGPFTPKVTFKLLENDQKHNAGKLGTYGVIKGASAYIGASIQKDEPFALETLGYTFEKLVLYAASLGLGTCWLGGTFKKGAFAEAMGVKEDVLFPIVSPVGYPLAKGHLMGSFIRFAAKSNQRKAWNELFFDGTFSAPLSTASAGKYEFLLEMVRLAPSASNKQPWRIIKEGNTYHFYELKTPGYSDRLGYDIQKIDIGIALCHFHLAALEKHLQGEFKHLSPSFSDKPTEAHYIISWESVSK